MILQTITRMHRHQSHSSVWIVIEPRDASSILQIDSGPVAENERKTDWTQFSCFISGLGTACIWHFWFLLFPFRQWYRKFYAMCFSHFQWPVNTYTDRHCVTIPHCVTMKTYRGRGRERESGSGNAEGDALYRIRTTTNGLYNFPFVWNLNSSFYKKLPTHKHSIGLLRKYIPVFVSLCSMHGLRGGGAIRWLSTVCSSYPTSLQFSFLFYFFPSLSFSFSSSFIHTRGILLSIWKHLFAFVLLCFRFVYHGKFVRGFECMSADHPGTQPKTIAQNKQTFNFNLIKVFYGLRESENNTFSIPNKHRLIEWWCAASFYSYFCFYVPIILHCMQPQRHTLALNVNRRFPERKSKAKDLSTNCTLHVIHRAIVMEIKDSIQYSVCSHTETFSPYAIFSANISHVGVYANMTLYFSGSWQMLESNHFDCNFRLLFSNRVSKIVAKKYWVTQWIMAIIWDGFRVSFCSHFFLQMYLCVPAAPCIEYTSGK